MKEKFTPSSEIITHMESLLNVASDSTRLKIMFSLIDDSLCSCGCEQCSECRHRCCMIEKCVNDIINDVNLSQSLVSHQLKVLKDADLVNVRKQGVKAYYSLKDGHVKELLKIVLEHVMEKENAND